MNYFILIGMSMVLLISKSESKRKSEFSTIKLGNRELTDEAILTPLQFYEALADKIVETINNGECEAWSFRDLLQVGRLIESIDLNKFDQDKLCNHIDVPALYYVIVTARTLIEFGDFVSDIIKDKINPKASRYHRNIDHWAMLETLGKLMKVPDIVTYFYEVFDYGMVEKPGKEEMEASRLLQKLVEAMNYEILRLGLFKPWTKGRYYSQSTAV